MTTESRHFFVSKNKKRPVIGLSFGGRGWIRQYGNVLEHNINKFNAIFVGWQ